MARIGIDFGSTTTIVSVYKAENEAPVAIAFNETGTQVAIPTVVAEAKTLSGKTAYYIGTEAKNRHKAIHNFRAFKMLLAENDESLLASRGFEGQYTPTKVTRVFLDKVIAKVKERLGVNTIDGITIGAPEIWTSELVEVEREGRMYSGLSTNLDGRAILSEICTELVGKNAEIQVVGEPVAASAYFAHKFYKQKRSAFDGHILLIDYGGGTLDITLTEVRPRANIDGSLCMEVSAPFRTGAGENRERGKIGKAGIEYMETLTRMAIKEAFPGTVIECDEDFYAATDAVESWIISHSGLQREVFEEYKDDFSQLSDPEVVSILKDNNYYYAGEFRYRQTDVRFTYEMMVKAYNEVIWPVLDATLEEALAYTKEHHINSMARNNDSFKVVLAGGFGNFYLVKDQIAKKLDYNHNDKRCEYIMSKSTEGELAISYGTALIAEGKIKLKNTAPFSIGVAAYDRNNKYSKTYALRFNEEIECDKLYFQSDLGGNPQSFVAGGKAINKFIINTTDNDGKACIMTPKQEFLKRLGNAFSGNVFAPHLIAFSMSTSGTISIHVFPNCYTVKECEKTKIEPIRLTKISELFNTQELERAFPDEY